MVFLPYLETAQEVHFSITTYKGLKGISLVKCKSTVMFFKGGFDQRIITTIIPCTRQMNDGKTNASPLKSVKSELLEFPYLSQKNPKARAPTITPTKNIVFVVFVRLFLSQTRFHWKRNPQRKASFNLIPVSSIQTNVRVKIF